MTATTEQRVQLLQHLIDHRPISTAGPQVGLSPSEAHSIATDYGYPNRRRLQAELAKLRGKPTPTSSASSSRPSSANGPSSKEVRNWAAHNGLAVPSRGRVPANVVEAYRNAHADA